MNNVIDSMESEGWASEMDATYKLYNKDCLEVIPMLSGVFALVTDPPYGIGKNNIVPFKRTERNSKGRVSDDFEWDESRKTDEVKLAVSIAEVSIIFGGNYYTDVLPPSRCWIVWDKMNSGNFSDFEMAWTSFDGASRMFRYMWNGMIKQKPEQRFHPTQKPLDLMRWCIEKFTKPNQIIFDPFMGSGTTGVAALQLGRYFIGCEISAEYFAIAEKRIKQAALQPGLFTPANNRLSLDVTGSPAQQALFAAEAEGAEDGATRRR